MNIEINKTQFRRLIDMVYIGNWVLNAMRGDDRIADYDEVENILFSLCPKAGMSVLTEFKDGEFLPSRAFAEGGIHDAIMDYEDAVFFDILAEELARRDMEQEGVSETPETLSARIDEYIHEFEQNGTDNISVK